jgi:hypothetical protein
MGAVVRLIDMCVRGIRTGTMTKKMEMMKTTRVTIENRVIIENGH